MVALLGVLSLAAVAPFLLTFRPPVVAAGGGLPLGLVAQRSQLGQFVQFWGAQLLLLIPVVLVAAGALGLPRLVERLLRSALGASGAAGPAGAPAIVAGRGAGAPAAAPRRTG